MSLIVICLIALFIGSPINGLSPSFSTVALDMGYDIASRDLYFASYISLSIMLGQILGSIVGGYYADVYDRKTVLLISLLADSIVLITFGIPQSLFIFLFLRLGMGFFQGLCIPVLFSLIGDLYQNEIRVMSSAAASSCLGGGLLIGQLFCGFVFQYFDWRFPFVLLGCIGLALAIVTQKWLTEPIRGDNECEKSVVYDFNYIALYRSLSTPTILLMFIQSIPGTVPWGVLSTHLQDLLTQDYHVSVSHATMYIGIFGIGGAIGGILSGILGGYFYTLNRMMLPVFMGTTCAASSALLQTLLQSDSRFQQQFHSIIPTLLLAGAFAAVSGTNIRTIVINVTLPECRGSAIGILNVLGCLGRGIGPTLTGLYMNYTKSGRVEAIRVCLYLWIISGAILCCGGLTIAKDEDRMKLSYKKAETIDKLST